MLATGLSFEMVAGFTLAQMNAIQRAIRRHWEVMASINGLQVVFGGGKKTNEKKDDTDAFEAKVKTMKKVTGKNVLDLWEVIN